MAPKPASPPPAYFLSLSLENVRSFGAKQTISFADKERKPVRWTIILGDNGVGKTTVLRSLAGITPVQSQNPPQGIYEPSHFAFGSNQATKLRSNWKIVRTNKEGFSCVDVRFSLNYSFILKNFQLNAHSAQAHLAYRHEADGKRLGGSALGFEEKDIGLICYGYGAGRTTGNSTLSETPETQDTCASLFNDRADLLNPEEWFLNIDYGIRLSADDKRKQLSDANDRVRQMLKDVLPGVTDIRITNSGTPQKPQISLQFLLYDTWVRLRDMSLGYQTLIVWLTDLASKLYVRYPESDNPLAQPAIVLIDEIDLHLHPQWQRELLGMLSKIFPETQFIATAHSPLVVQAAGDVGANVVLLKREGDQTVVVTDVENVRGWRLDQILTSELFGLETARSPDTERMLQRRAALIAKTKRTAAETNELTALTQVLDAGPVGETPSEREVNAVLQELRQRLPNKDASNSAA